MKLINDKKGIELSLNFLVTIIIALTIFMFGIGFIYNLASEAQGLEEVSIDSLDRRIGSLLCDGTDRVCIGMDRQTIERGEFGIFGLKITNVNADEESFDIIVEPSGFTQNNGPIEPVTGDQITTKYRSNVVLERNKQEEMGIGVQVSKDARTGTYILDVRVEPYPGVHKLYVVVT